MFIRQLFDRLSVRARVAALGVVPIIGFLAYGLAYMASDIEVGRAFESVRRDNAVVDASADLKGGLLAMRLATVTFATNPTDAQVKAFDQAQQLAMKSLDRIQATLMSSQQDVITPLRITIRDLKASFESLVSAERALGFNETQGTTADLIAASAAIQHIISNDLSWVADHEFGKTPGIAAHHAALRSRIPPQSASLLDATRDALERTIRRAAFPRRSQTLQRYIRTRSTARRRRSRSSTRRCRPTATRSPSGSPIPTTSSRC